MSQIERLCQDDNVVRGGISLHVLQDVVQDVFVSFCWLDKVLQEAVPDSCKLLPRRISPLRRLYKMDRGNAEELGTDTFNSFLEFISCDECDIISPLY